ncbi:N-acetyl-gamma-glutamyl-phosphate reductase [Candidatus Aerophobetes bacterium]|nr:N-acetyl-gamma-glutamyl-phosphate reductase [Candidatus Aerophobetes bacterium]
MQKENKVKVSVIGATGYTGVELVRLLLKHPGVEIDTLTSESFAGKKISEVYPQVKCDIVCESLNIDKISSPLVFTALPHGKSAKVVGKLFDRGVKIVDFSADFRLHDAGVYQSWYGISHAREDLLSEAVYGLPEIYREKIKQALLVANPGCYPTSIILALAPLLKNKLIKREGLVADSKSGVSGAGRTPTLETHFPEVSENINAYNVAGHRHLPEIEQELTKIANENVTLTFVPHLIPANRGILSTCYVDLVKKMSTEEVLDIYTKFYGKEPFVEVLPPGFFPHTREVIWSNRCRIGLYVDRRDDKVVVISAIDNLVKGASGQAIQNMNLMCGFDEDLGLE